VSDTASSVASATADRVSSMAQPMRSVPLPMRCGAALRAIRWQRG
jgi:hypothetical protein